VLQERRTVAVDGGGEVAAFCVVEGPTPALVIAGPSVRGGRPLGTRSTFGDLGATICDYLGIARDGLAGTSALPEVVK